VSGIVGLFNLDGRPADGGMVGRMLAAIATRGPDASRVRTGGAVGLGHCLLAATPESIGEVQPHLEADGALSIVFDGRIDNRGELTEEFERARVPLSADFDAAFALAAYRRWGVDCAARLLGDFAFAVWDREHRRLFCARDVMAQKPFYYHLGADVFLFASEPQALLQHPSVSRRPNEGMAGEHLSIITSTTDTLLADVQRLPSGHRIVVSAAACRLDKYWDIDPARTIRYRTVDEYGEHLHALLRQVVGDRLRSSTAVGVMLSGGIDSSSIMATAMALRPSDARAHGCAAFSLIDPGGPLDERAFIDQTVAMLGCASHQYTADDDPVDAYRDVTRRRADVASAPCARLMTSVQRGARQHGVRVLLSGVGGDEWLGGTIYHAADLFRSLRWTALGAYLRSLWSSGAIADPRTLLKVMTWPLLPRAARKRIKAAIGYDTIPRWVNPAFARRIALADRLYPIAADPPFATIAQRSIFRDMTSGLMVHCLEDEERSAAESGLEIRYPFHDRRMMEFGLAIPEELRWRGGERKFVLRDAMRDSLPAGARARPDSPNAGSVFLPALRALADQGLLRQPAIEREGWAQPGESLAFYHRILARERSGDPDYTDDVWPMWTVAAVELWMREVADRSSSDTEEDRCEMTTALSSARQGRNSEPGNGRT
jgi:asparagine synthase (glutamine-hydrolysing)